MEEHARDADSDNDRKPIGEVLPGMGIHPLLARETPLEAFVLIKTLDPTGRPSWSYRTTHPPNREELLGALTIQVQLLTEKLRDDWVDDEDA